MNHKERIEAALSFRETDQMPYSLWWHFPNRDRSPRRLAELMLETQRKYDFDFIKYMPYGMYSTVDWGMDLRVFEGFCDPPVAAQLCIKEPEDWEKLRPVGGTQGEYAVVLESQRLILEAMEEEIPLVQTVFSPLTTCAKMAGPETLVKHLHEAPEKVQRALEIITETTKEFALESVRRGAAGIFFATQMSTHDLLDQDLHQEFVKQYDLLILRAVERLSWFNILHIHGDRNLLFDTLLDYPVQVINWHDRDAGPSMAKARQLTEKCFCAGISQQNTLTKGSSEAIVAEVQDAMEHNGGKGLILGPGCVLDPRTPEETLLLIKKCVRNL